MKARIRGNLREETDRLANHPHQRGNFARFEVLQRRGIVEQYMLDLDAQPLKNDRPVRLEALPAGSAIPFPTNGSTKISMFAVVAAVIATGSRVRSPLHYGLPMEKDSLILQRASTSRPSGDWNEDDFDVLVDGDIVGRLFKVNAAPMGTPPWMWAIAFWHHEDRTPTHGYAATREAAVTAFAKSWRRE